MSITRTAPLPEAQEWRPEWRVIIPHCIVLVVLVPVWGFLATLYLGAVLRRRRSYLVGLFAVAVNSAFAAILLPRLLDAPPLFAGLGSVEFWDSFPKEVALGMAGSRIVAYLAGGMLGMAWRMEDSPRMAAIGAAAGMALLYGGYRVEQAPLEQGRVVAAMDVVREEYTDRFEAAIRDIREAAPKLEQSVVDRVRKEFSSRPASGRRVNAEREE